jgi:hypothetical protein
MVGQIEDLVLGVSHFVDALNSQLVGSRKAPMSSASGMNLDEPSASLEQQLALGEIPRRGPRCAPASRHGSESV